MNDEIITPENLSPQSLKAVFDSAYMDTTLDAEGNLKIKDRVTLHVRPREDRIRIFALFGFKPSASQHQRLEFVNKVNMEYIIVRATTGDNDTLFFDYDIPVAGGITKKAIVLLVKRFCSIPHAAVQEHGINIVE